MRSPTVSSSPHSSPRVGGPHAPMFQVFGELPFRTDGDLLALAFAPDGSLWSVEEPGVLRHWRLAERQMLDWHLLSDLETLWVFSSGATLLASGSDDLSLWDVGRGRLLTVLEQPSWVTAVAFSPDAALLATGHDDGIVRLWDLRRRCLARTLDGHGRSISALAFSADGARLASAGEDRIIRLWQLPDGRPDGSLIGHTDRIPALAWHPQGHRLYSAGWDTTARVWDASSCEPIILLNSHAAQVTTLALSLDGRLLACADSTSAIHLWDTAAHKTRQVLRGPTGDVRCLAFSADGEQLAAGGGDRVVHLWDSLDRGGPPPSPPAPLPSAREEESDTSSLRRSAEDRPALVTRQVFGPSAGGVGGPEHEVRTNLALSPDGARLACIDGDYGLRVWETASARPVLTDAEVGPLFALAWSPDGRRIAGGGHGAIRLWNAADGQRQPVQEGQPLPTTVLAFTPDGAILASASALGFDVWLWNPNTGEPILLIPDAVDGCAVEALAFHPEGRLLAVGGIDWLATGGSDGMVVLWDVPRRGPAATWQGGVRGLAFHPSGRLLAGATLARSVRVWDPRTGQLVAELTGHDDLVNCVTYSPDGNWLASAGADRTVRLWDADTGRLLARAELDTQVKALAFSPDGRYLFTGNANTSCYQLDVVRLLDAGT